MLWLSVLFHYVYVCVHNFFYQDVFFLQISFRLSLQNEKIESLSKLQSNDIKLNSIMILNQLHVYFVAVIVVIHTWSDGSVIMIV